MNSNRIFYKYKSLDNFEFILDLLLKERLYAAGYHELNDPMEGVVKIDGTVPREREPEWEAITSSLRICCFTKEPNNTLMWAHYAEGARGCVIKFELLEEQQFYKVSYTKKPEISNSDFSTNKAVEILKYKSKPWKYEEEYRCIEENKNFIPIKVHSITFGARANKESVKLLSNILMCCKPDLKVIRSLGHGDSLFKGPSVLASQARTYLHQSGARLEKCPKCFEIEDAQQRFTR